MKYASRTLCALVSLMLLCTNAIAQSNESKSASEDRRALEEIVVTASKRETSEFDASLSITAIGSEEIASRGLYGMNDYLNTVPSVSYVEQEPTRNFVIMRGIASGYESNYRTGGTVGQYFGEVPITSASGILGGTGIDMKLVDIERIEVLRGPQGTTFGDATVAGAVRTIPRTPELDAFSASAAAGISETAELGGSNYEVEGYINAPLVADTFGVRAVAYKSEDSGVYRNIAGDDETFLAYAESVGAEDFAVSLDDRGNLETTGARLSAAWQITDKFNLTASHANQNQEQEGLAQFDSAGISPENQTGYEYARFQNGPEGTVSGRSGSFADSEIEITALYAQYDFGWASLEVPVSKVDSESVQQFGGFVGLPLVQSFRSEHESLVAEARLVSTLEGNVQFLIGYYHAELDDLGLEQYPNVGPPSLSPLGDGTEVLLAIFTQDRQLEQDALFGELSYELLDGLTVTAGVRSYDYHRDDTLSQAGWLFGTELDDPTVSEFRLDDSGQSYKFNVSYSPTDDQMMYLAWSEGFRLGRPVQGLPPAVCDVDSDGLVDGTGIPIASTGEIKTDYVDNYELGWKARLFDNRVQLSSAIYHITWAGIPVREFAECGTVSLAYTINAGDATSTGIEIESDIALSDNLSLHIGAGYADAELAEDAPSLGEEGERLPGSPRINGNVGLQYDFALGNQPAFFRTDISYLGDYFVSFGAARAEKESGDYTKVNARFGVSYGDMSFEVYGENLTNDDSYSFLSSSNTPNGYRLRPRTFGLLFRYTL